MRSKILKVLRVGMEQGKDSEYYRLYIKLPTPFCRDNDIQRGDELEVSAQGDVLTIRKVKDERF